MEDAIKRVGKIIIGGVGIENPTREDVADANKELNKIWVPRRDTEQQQNSKRVVVTFVSQKRTVYALWAYARGVV